MAVTGVIDAGVIQAMIDHWEGNSSNVTSIDVNSVQDQEANFDTDHEVYTNSLVNNDSLNVVVDNSNGLENPMHATPTINYSYSSGYSTQHQETQGFSVGITQSFKFDFVAADTGTTLSTTGNFSWTEGTSEDHTTTIQNSLSADVDVPQYKIYEAKLFYNQEQVSVPYSGGVTASGTWTEIWGDQVTIGNAFDFSMVGPPPPYTGVDWSDFFVGTTYDTGRYVLTGTLTSQNGGEAKIKFYDITNQSQAQQVTEAQPGNGAALAQAAHDPAVPIGVHAILHDGGGQFRDTPFDDWVDGGCGDDRIILLSGEDVAYGFGGDDVIRARDTGRSLLDGGAGDDRISLVSTALHSNLFGGDGNDRIKVHAPETMVDGGAGDDRFVMDCRAAGSVILDNEGHNSLRITAAQPLRFEHVGDNLYIITDGAMAYQRTEHVVWVDFFAGGHNSVNGLDAAEIEAIIAEASPPAGSAMTAEQEAPGAASSAEWQLPG